MKSRLPINITAPLLVGIPVLALGVWLSVMWSRQSTRIVSDLVEDKIKAIHELVALKIDDMVSILPRVCQINQHLVVSGVLDPNALEDWRPTLYQELSSFDMLSAVTWGSEDGRSAWVARYTDGSIYWDLKSDPSIPTMFEWRIDEEGNIDSEPTNQFDYDLHTRPWYLTPRAAGQPAWSPPYIWAGAADSEVATVGISYGIPLYLDDGSLLGVVDADFTLDDLSGFLRTIEIGKTGVAILAARDGTLLAASRDTRIASDDGTLFQVAESIDPMIASIAEPLGNLVPGEIATASIQLNGEDHFLQITTAGTDVGLDWRLATIVPESDFLADIESQFQKSLILSIIVVIAVVLLAAGGTRWLLTPLIRLVSAVRDVGQGKLDTRVALGTANEYVMLGSAINEMTENLEQSRDRELLLQRELDHRVKNMLAQIVALCRQTADRATEDQSIVNELVGQVTCLSGVHELLGKRGQVGLYMRELIAECCRPYLSSETQLELTGAEIFVRPRAAMCLTIVCNELATNARKYGALISEGGLISIQWSETEDDEGEPALSWTWTESGGTAPTSNPTPGFGTRLLESLIPYEMSGSVSLTFDPSGLRYHATMPMAEFSAPD
ncbi:MAG: HAMP domain-containing protein [Phycisphaerales bacterium]|nr:HAMP domain-containing protein [Phycisphaerales bacterium]